MRTRASKISLIIFVVLLLLSGCLLSTPGDYWPWYSVMAVFAAVPLVVGPREHRLAAIVALVLSAILIAGDIHAGNRFHDRIDPSIGRRMDRSNQ